METTSTFTTQVDQTTEFPQEATPDVLPAPAEPLSKNALKKLAKAARFAEQKKERRAAEKQRKKEKKREQAQKRAAGELEEGEDEQGRRKRARVGEHKGPRRPFNARVVVDLGFDELMSDNEIKSLGSQLAFTYSANRKAAQPFASLLFTSLNGRTSARLDSVGDASHKRWVDTEWWTEGYERLWEGLDEDPAAIRGTAGSQEQEAEGSNTATSTELHKDGARKPQVAPRESVVYLTADTDDELTELKEGETYIIGGICDHNRYKNLCYKKSQTTGVRSARLPIGTYLADMKTRKVLTVNQTFEILVKWLETRDWEQALYSVMPKRKFDNKAATGKKGGDNKTTDAEDEVDVERAVQVLHVEELEEDNGLDLQQYGESREPVETVEGAATSELSPDQNLKVEELTAE